MITAVTEQVAKLMATEDITVCMTNDSTASFSLLSRVLRIPNWSKLTPVEMDLLIGHEIGHALYTDKNKWCDEIDRFKGKKNVFQRCLNVIEDARIERKVKVKYPGMRKIFFHGYTLLLQRPEFNYTQKDLNTINAVDFINAYFKFNGILSCFTNLRPELKDLVDEITNIETIEEAIVAAHKLYDLTKNLLVLQKQEEYIFSNFDEKSIPVPVEPVPEEKEEVEPGEEDEEKMNFHDAELDENNKSQDGAGGKNTTSVDDELDEIGDKEDELSKVSKNNNGSGDIEYCHMALPEPTDLKNIITPYKAILKNVEEIKVSSYMKSTLRKKFESMKSVLDEDAFIESDDDKEYSIVNPMEKFYKDYHKTISLYKKIFEMRKKARQHNRTMQFRTGVIDPEQLYSYRYNDQLFKTHEIKENGKNHGLIFILDLSSSMQRVFCGAIKQMMQQIMFCRESGIPFVAYGFSSNVNCDILEINQQFKINKQYDYYIGMGSFTLLELLSSEMSQNDFKRMFKFCFTVLGASSRSNDYYGLGSTPLNQTVLCLEELVKKFKSSTNVQEVNIVFLTDGESNMVSVNMNDPNKYTRSYYNYEYIIVDPKTNYTIRCETNRISTEALLKMVRKRLARLGNVSVVNFRIVASFMRLPGVAAKKINFYDFQDRNPFISLKEHDGYTEYFFVNRSVFSAKNNASFAKELKDADTMRQIQDTFVNKSSIKKAHMKMIESFIDNIV